MQTIEVDDSVYSALEQRVKGFGEKPNDVIKRLLAVADKVSGTSNESCESKKLKARPSPIQNLIESPEFLRGNAKDRYFHVLRFICKEDPERFEKLNGFQKGSRVQISKDAATIQRSGRHTYPQRLDETPYWISTNLSNGRKQTLLEDIMRFLGYPEGTIAEVVRSIIPKRTVLANFISYSKP